MFPKKDLDLMKIAIDRNKALIKIMTSQVITIEKIRDELLSELSDEELAEMYLAVVSTTQIIENLEKQTKSREHLILLNSKW